MQLKTLQYRIDSGWSEPLPCEMDSTQTAIIFFATSELAEIEQALRELNELFPTSHITGCSTAGEIFQAELSDHSISVAIMRFSTTQIRSACISLTDVADAEIACRELAADLLTDDLRGIFLLSEGLHVNATQVLRGIAEITANNIVVTGGLAGDGKRFKETWVYGSGKARPNNLCAIAFYGDKIQIGHGSEGGWDIFGPDRRITKAEDNVLYELDGQPALALYKKYLGDRATGLPATGLLFPLAINESPEDRQNEVVRTILSINENNQSITFASNIPQGYYARLMRANLDRLIEGASEAAGATRKIIPESTETLSIAISCVGRRLVLGDRAEEEIEAVLESLPAGTQQIGFYSYGEVSPQVSGICDLHNQTMTITTFSELV